MRDIIRRAKVNDAGSTLVEFGLVATLFIFLLLSVVEMSRMVLVYTAMANAAHAGTRYAIVHGGDLTSGASGPGNPCTCPNVTTAVRNYASTGILNSSNVSVVTAYPGGSNTAGSTVTVTVTYTYDPLIGYFGSILNKNLGSTSEGVIVF